jgi:hypothetical protein
VIRPREDATNFVAVWSRTKGRSSTNTAATTAAPLLPYDSAGTGRPSPLQLLRQFFQRRRSNKPPDRVGFRSAHIGTS